MWVVLQVSYQTSELLSKWIVAQVNYHTRELSYKWDIVQVGCRTSQLLKKSVIIQKSCRTGKLSYEWVVRQLSWCTNKKSYKVFVRQVSYQTRDLSYKWVVRQLIVGQLDRRTTGLSEKWHAPELRTNLIWKNKFLSSSSNSYQAFHTMLSTKHYVLSIFSCAAGVFKVGQFSSECRDQHSQMKESDTNNISMKLNSPNSYTDLVFCF